jgi:hypothetical protein
VREGEKGKAGVLDLVPPRSAGKMGFFPLSVVSDFEILVISIGF